MVKQIKQNIYIYTQRNINKAVCKPVSVPFKKEELVSPPWRVKTVEKCFSLGGCLDIEED